MGRRWLQERQRGWVLPEDMHNGFSDRTNLIAQGIVVIYLGILASVLILSLF